MLRFFVLVGLAAVFGMLSANYVAQGNAGLFIQSQDQWKWWPNAGSATTDPYTRYYFQSQNRLPLSKFETLELEARFDEAGRELSADCIYEMRGVIPRARWWTVAAYDRENPKQPGDGNSSLSAHDVLLNDDGQVVVQIAREPRPGNWISLRGNDAFSLLLRLYGPVYGLANRASIEEGLPAIKRVVCR